MSAITGVMQDYLKVIYKLQQQRRVVSTSEIAARMQVSAAAATSMIKRLARLRLAAYTPYHGFGLTTAGQRIALETIRHHRLLELYLAQHLGVSLDKVDGEAERLEHVLSEDVEARIAASLGNPTHDPHGDPIPAKDGTLHDVRHPTLRHLPVGEAGVVDRVSDRSPDLVRRLAKLGVLPGAAIKMLGHRGGGWQVELGGRPLTLPRELAEGVYIRWAVSPRHP
ncbi:MAG TPA: metal-dependent transcriptional regulator [bacterium]|nr:metal-dependent transcriptional regulator [bacterium]